MHNVKVILLDAPIQSRRRLHDTIHRTTSASWLVDGPATVTNLREEIGADATILRYYTPMDQDVIVVDGMHRMSLRQQADMLQKVVNSHSVRVLVLGGDTTGRGLARGRAMNGWTLCCHALRLGGGATEEVDVWDPQGLRSRWLFVVAERLNLHRLTVWTCRSAATSTGAPEFEQCVDIHSPMPSTKRRWLCAPVTNSRLVSWVCSNVNLHKGTMLVVNWESECRTAAAHCHAGHVLKGYELCDGTETYVGQDIRCVLTLRGRMRVGEVLHVVGPVDDGTGLALQHANSKGVVRITKPGCSLPTEQV